MRLSAQAVGEAYTNRAEIPCSSAGRQIPGREAPAVGTGEESDSGADRSAQHAPTKQMAIRWQWSLDGASRGVFGPPRAARLLSTIARSQALAR